MFKIYVGNLDYKVKIEQLRELFSVFAPIEDLVIPIDPKTKRSKGFAIVMIRDSELGQVAIRAMQGKRLLGRQLVVNEAVKGRKGAPAQVTKADLMRQGPFGPRMARFGDPRQRGGSRNPRRGILGRGEKVPEAGAGPMPPAPIKPGVRAETGQTGSERDLPPRTVSSGETGRPVRPRNTPESAASPLSGTGGPGTGGIAQTDPAHARPPATPTAGGPQRTLSAGALGSALTSPLDEGVAELRPAARPKAQAKAQPKKAVAKPAGDASKEKGADAGSGDGKPRKS